MTLDIQIYADSQSFNTVATLIQSEDARLVLGDIYDQGMISLSGSRPVFPNQSHLDYLTSMGVPEVQLPHYRIYIGRDISEVTERSGGVEIPATILDRAEEFKQEVIMRIRNKFDSARDD